LLCCCSEHSFTDCNTDHIIHFWKYHMSPKDAFHKTVHEAPGGCAALAVRLGTTAAVLRNKACPTTKQNVVTLDDVDRVMGLTEDYSVLHALAANHGFVCSKVEAGQASDMAVLESVTDIWAKLGAVGGEVHAALADGKVERHEVQRIEAAIYTAMRPMMELLNRLNGMAEK
jgi:hypothetical protein